MNWIFIVIDDLVIFLQKLQKLQFQERVIEEVKMAVKPYYAAKKITKEQYKLILRKAVPKVSLCFYL